MTIGLASLTKELMSGLIGLKIGLIGLAGKSMPRSTACDRKSTRR